MDMWDRMYVTYFCMYVATCYTKKIGTIILILTNAEKT